MIAWLDVELNAGIMRGTSVRNGKAVTKTSGYQSMAIMVNEDCSGSDWDMKTTRTRFEKCGVFVPLNTADCQILGECPDTHQKMIVNYVIRRGLFV